MWGRTSRGRARIGRLMSSNSGAGAAGRIATLVEASLGSLPVRIRAWDGSEAGPQCAPVLVVRSRRALRRMLWNADELGLAQAFVTGDIDTDGDLGDSLRTVWAAARERGTQEIELGWAERMRLVIPAARLGAIGPRPALPQSQAVLSGQAHTRRRDRDAISHHYDLSNEFYRFILDESMAYSSAYWAQPYSPGSDYTIADAQRDKLDMVCRKLDLQPGMRLLDVGCGWGSLILHAATHYGVHATGVTLSAEQHAFITDRIAEHGLEDRVEVRLQDYRQIDPFPRAWDAVSSLEMGEHVGQENYANYASVLFGAVRPAGRLLLQQMSRRPDARPGGGKFIESFIAPDMHMRPVGQTVDLLSGAGFEVRDVHAMREHYVWTVEAWLAQFEANIDTLTALVGPEVVRVWRLYLVGGALSFEEGRMGVDQILAVRPDRLGRSGMPLRRGDWDGNDYIHSDQLDTRARREPADAR
jgi:cyclopropane-fatty-acyl-phospholipid synthase